MIRRLLGILVLVALVATPASAEPWYKSRRFWRDLALVGSAAAVDAISSRRYCVASQLCIENDPLFGRWPSAFRQYGEGAAIEFGIAYVASKRSKLEERVIVSGSMGIDLYEAAKTFHMQSEGIY